MAERALHHRSPSRGTQLARHIVENFPNGAIYVLDRELRYLFAAGRELEQVGLEAEGFLGKTIWEALPAGITEQYEEPCRAALGGLSVEFEHDLHGHTYAMFATPLDWKDDSALTIMLISRNITRQKQSEEAAAQLLQQAGKLPSGSNAYEWMPKLQRAASRLFSMPPPMASP